MPTNDEPAPSQPSESAEDYKRRRELEDRLRDDLKKSTAEEFEKRSWRTKVLITGGVALGVVLWREIPLIAREAVKQETSLQVVESIRQKAAEVDQTHAKVQLLLKALKDDYSTVVEGLRNDSKFQDLARGLPGPQGLKGDQGPGGPAGG